MNQPLFIMTEEQIEAFGKKLLQDFIDNLPVAANVKKREIISPDELCKRLGISIPTQIRYRKKGILPWLEIGDQIIRYDWDRVLDALAKDKSSIKCKI